MLHHSGYPSTIVLDHYRLPEAGVVVMPRTQTPAPQRQSLADRLSDEEIQRTYFGADLLPPAVARLYAKDCDVINEESAVRLDTSLRHAIRGQIAALKQGS